MKDFQKAKKTVEVSVGESVRISLGVERAKVLAIALRCHPAVLVFPGWDVGGSGAA